MSEVDMEHMKGEKGDIGNIGIKQHTGLWLNKSVCVRLPGHLALVILYIDP